MLCEAVFLSFSSKLTKERILNCAKEEFLCTGFSGANLREIAKKAKVTTGALYNHFKNKETLFEEIVGKFANDLFVVFDAAHSRTVTDAAFDKIGKKDSMINGTLEVLEFIYDNLDTAKLLFFYSSGTKYENYKDKLVEIEEKSSIKALEAENFNLNEVNRFFVHVMSTSGINNMLEAVHHNLSKEQAFEYMRKIQRFYFAGVMEILSE